ncbi:zf-HC2 domain-containing protein [Dasania sp. GY-MA-18]|uniref:Zf-HC2 domain-containing protein n=1 Tax=Dasania phycosphaerae TaxID=2950436 RepID=A0A9J6RJ80_9GAMM|nr:MULTISPECIES: zf-HC2 domain-containing protein [Dasania]MCR8921876.1 zf-HC2 domain-containing protein [Dasania sp. GY-MA-18]MCZ0864304.1 zf-HC2 domain-containing protein [Dasania phycosphaerae]MCZ0868032.1 zf-HC2 domain-containing protein [Dasania phycosphaerae]
MMNCQQVTRLLSDAQERELSLKERTALKVHTMMCSGCRNFGQQMGTLREIARKYVNGTTGDNSDQLTANSDDDRRD